MFWIVETDDLEKLFGRDAFDIEYGKSDSGDFCHVLICRLIDEQGEKFSEAKCKPPDVYLCVGDKCEQITSEEIPNLGKILYGN